MNINELHTQTPVPYSPSSENLRAIAQLSNNARFAYVIGESQKRAWKEKNWLG
jgi:hypothetical protein